MLILLPIVQRLQCWDAAFDPDMTDPAVSRLLAIAPFSQMDAEKFPKRTPLREILPAGLKLLLPRE